MSIYSKEFKEEAIRLSDEIGNKKASSPARHLVLHIGGPAQTQQAQAQGSRNTQRRGASNTQPRS